MASDLSRSLVDAAAEADWQAHNAAVLKVIGKRGSREEQRRELSRARSRAAAAAVLETLARHCDPVPVGDDSTSQALLANTELRALARAVLGEKEETDG